MNSCSLVKKKALIDPFSPKIDSFSPVIEEISNQAVKCAILHQKPILIPGS